MMWLGEESNALLKQLEKLFKNLVVRITDFQNDWLRGFDVLQAFRGPNKVLAVHFSFNIQSAARNEPQIWYNKVVLSRKED